MNYPHAPQAQPPKKQGMPIWLLVIIILIPVLIGGVGILAVLSIYGVRKYITNAKSAEARNAVSFISRAASKAYEDNHRLCPSASRSVPPKVMSARKYQSSPSEWAADEKNNAGFACLKFSMTEAQYYSYGYTATDDSFTASATGDLNGDGTTSLFQISGHVENGQLVIDPSIREVNPDE